MIYYNTSISFARFFAAHPLCCGLQDHLLSRTASSTMHAHCFNPAQSCSMRHMLNDERDVTYPCPMTLEMGKEGTLKIWEGGCIKWLLASSYRYEVASETQSQIALVMPASITS
jgi:hypothetical protein